MARGRFLCLIPMLLLLGGLTAPGLQQECRPETIADTADTIDGTLERDLESELLAMTNQQRIRQGLPPLTLDRTLLRIAREHSFGMARQGFISHDLPSGDLKIRMTRGGYLYRMARENVASARTVTLAQTLLMNSPPHHSNILAEDVNSVGIGIVRCAPPYDKELYITEIFASPRKRSQPTATQAMLDTNIGD